MKVLARQLTADLYGCKSEVLVDTGEISNMVYDRLQNIGYEVLHTALEQTDGGHCAVVLIFNKGYIALQIYTALRYVSADVFLSGGDAEPERLFSELRKFFKPEKTKITILKRGDFKSGGDIKPKTKTRMAPLRKLHNTGAKVIRTLARRKN